MYHALANILRGDALFSAFSIETILTIPMFKRTLLFLFSRELSKYQIKSYHITLHVNIVFYFFGNSC